MGYYSIASFGQSNKLQNMYAQQSASSGGSLSSAYAPIESEPSYGYPQQDGVQFSPEALESQNPSGSQGYASFQPQGFGSSPSQGFGSLQTQGYGSYQQQGNGSSQQVGGGHHHHHHHHSQQENGSSGMGSFNQIA